MLKKFGRNSHRMQGLSPGFCNGTVLKNEIERDKKKLNKRD